MAQLTHKEPIKLKNNRDVNEKMIQEQLSKNPDWLGIDDNIVLVKREKHQPSGGFLDILYENEDDEIRYCVEIQLGATDSSHIIRTIEYWDNEQKRYPNIRHIPVLIAEDITGRFFNVINLFNKAIPMIAIQMSAFKEQNGDVSLSFTKIIDLYSLNAEDESEELVTDRAYWENKSTKNMVELAEYIFNDLKGNNQSISLKYNKFYIGLVEDGKANNYFSFVPKKSFVKIRLKSQQDDEIEQSFAEDGINADFCSRLGRKDYTISIKNKEQYERVKTKIIDVIKKNISNQTQ